VEGQNWDIYKCLDCDSHFIDTSKLDDGIYNLIYFGTIYSEGAEYPIFANQIKKTSKPIELLSKKDSTYFPIQRYLQNKSSLKILEVGCGLGYTSYAMAKAGHKVTGIDISSNDIKYAKENFEDPNLEYICSSLESYATNQKFDLIVSTEVFEHTPNPMEFIKILKSFLKDDGKILVTTPSKDFYDSVKKDFVWDLVMPPVHTCMATSKGVEKMASNLGLKVEFVKSNLNRTINKILITTLGLKMNILKKNTIYKNNNLTKISPLFKREFFTLLIKFKQLPVVKDIFYWIYFLIYKLFGYEGDSTMYFLLSKI
jgi:SAM-dependent methyltransferase